MMEWISVKDKEPDLNKVHFLVDGDSIYIRGSKSNPFLSQIYGEMKPMANINWTHWMPLPKPPVLHTQLREKLNHLLAMEKKEASQFVTEVLKYLMDSIHLEKNNETSQPSRNAFMKWISVKDRLPNKGDNILIDSGCGFVHVPAYDYDDLIHTGRFSGKSVKFTYWMPLPKATDKHNELRELINHLDDMERGAGARLVTEVLKYLMDSMLLEKNDGMDQRR